MRYCASSAPGSSFSFLAVYARTATLGDSLFQDVLLADRGGALLPLLLLVGRSRPPICSWRFDWSGRASARPWRPAFLAGARHRRRAAGGARQRLGPGDQQVPDPQDRARRSSRSPPTSGSASRTFERRPIWPRSPPPGKGAGWRESADPGWRFADPSRPYLRGRRPGRRLAGAAAVERHLPPARDLPGRRHGLPRPSGALADAVSGQPGRDRPDAAVWTRGLELRDADDQRPVRHPLLDRAAFAPLHHQLHLDPLRLPARGAAPPRLSRRDVQCRRHRLGQQHDVAETLVRPALALPRGERAGPAGLPGRRRARSGRSGGRAGPSSPASSRSATTRRSRRASRASTWPARATPSERILATTRYTDDVVREFVESLRGEPWFGDTLLVIVGDHGFNLGEHDVPPGRISLYRESIWVP